MAGDFALIDGQVPNAAYLNGYVRDQVVTICTSTTRPATPTTGRHIYETDTGRTLVFDGTYWQTVGGGAWGTWTPSFTQGVAVAGTVIEARYIKLGCTVHATALVQFTAGGTAGQNVFCNLPVPAFSTAGLTIGQFSYNGATYYTGSVAKWDAGVCTFVVTATSGGFLGVAPSVTLTSGYSVAFSCTYESAA